MSTIGPTLPPHLTSKRKRSVEDADDSERQSRSRSSSTSEEGKRRKVLGPSLPSKSIREESTGQSTNGGQESNSESDDDIGPAPAPPEGQSGGSSEPQNAMPQAVPDPEKPGKHLQREEWMLAPPSNVDWTSRIDPTKLKNRRFNTGKGARAPVQTDTTEDTLWTESPAEKTKRLQNEVMGIVDLKTTERPKERSSKATSGEAETRRKIEEHREYRKPSSLLQQHQRTTEQEDDDPSKRAFDREKDIGGSVMSATKRKEFMSRAADVGGRFSRGAYL